MGNLIKVHLHLNCECESETDYPRLFSPVYTSELLLHITASKTVETSLPQRYVDFEVPLWDWRPIFQ